VAQAQLNPESNVQFGEAAPARSPTASSTARSRTRNTTAARCSPSSSRPVRPGDPVRQQAAHRHLPAGQHGRDHARRDRGAGRRDPLRATGHRRPDRGRPHARREAASGDADPQPTTWCWRWATAPATPSRCCTSAASSWKPSPSPSAFASNTRSPDRQGRFGPHAGHPLLGAADYKLVHHASNGRAVYSFCMCPGGTVVAATSEPNRVVTNGMSQYSRNERNANAGIVVGITPEDYPGGPLARASPSSGAGSRGPSCWGAALRGARPAGGRLPEGQGLAPCWVTWSPRTSRA
jgi:hypothetical protein